MRHVKWWGVLGLAAILVASVAYFSSTTSAQVPDRDGVRPRRGIRALEILGGRGSEIGAAVRDVDEADVKREKLSAPAGAVVDEVRSDGPASKAGLKAGDVVMEFDGERVRSARHLTRVVQETPAGRTVKMVVMRDGKRVDLQIAPDTGAGLAIASDEIERRVRPYVERFGDRFGDHLRFEMPGPLRDFELFRRPARLGIGLQDLGDQLAAYFGVKDGVLVTSVSDNTPAAKAGIKAGDVITSVNGRSVRDGEDLRDEVGDLDDGREFPVVIVRDRKEITLKVTLEPSVERPRRRAPPRGI